MRREIEVTPDPSGPRQVPLSTVREKAVAVDHHALSRDALLGVVEEFIGREGTDYGARECSMEDKVADVMRQLDSGDVVITFDSETESVSIKPPS